ncbi:ATP-binding protein [Silvimonas amylolytica]|uniref:histidine kinase n=1 Tax=Silvimonas amylolytica TaxID=449663 RepID=A0ABQ2PRV0_9NEIS|nr:ATP-binding protein [Silvimonas amylolytica]GGP27712.1 sensor histidine kinase [Silvimonas amylolytica]
MKMPKGRLFWKILIGFWLTLTCVFFGVAAIFAIYDEQRAGMQDALATNPRMSVLTTSTASVLHYGGIEALREVSRSWPRFAKSNLLAVDDDGKDVFGRPVPARALAMAHDYLKNTPRPAEGEPDQSMPSVLQTQTPDHRNLMIFAVLDENMVRRTPPRQWLPPQLLWLGAFGSLIFSALLAWYLTRPIRLLQRAFDRVANGDLDERIAPRMGRRRDEIADLGHDFDRMAERLKQLVHSQRQLLHDVSHELRSPLARLQVSVGLARKQPDNLMTSLDRIERESKRLDELVGELLTLSRLEVAGTGDPDHYFDMIELLDTIVADARFEAENAGVDIALTMDPALDNQEAILRGRAEPLYRAVENVVRNALKYSRPGQRIDMAVHLAEAGHTLEISVADQGPGAPEDQLGLMFQPFVQLDGENRQPGYGLGLAIAQRAVQAHGGTIIATNRPEGGLAMIIRLPLQAGLTAAA